MFGIIYAIEGIKQLSKAIRLASLNFLSSVNLSFLFSSFFFFFFFCRKKEEEHSFRRKQCECIMQGVETMGVFESVSWSIIPLRGFTVSVQSEKSSR